MSSLEDVDGVDGPFERRIRLPSPRSLGEETLALHIRALGIEAPVRELQFAPPRRWRFDFAWPARKLALEVEGGTKGRSRHTRHDGFTRDAHKYNTAACLGWRVLRVTTEMVKSGEAARLVEEALR